MPAWTETLSTMVGHVLAVRPRVSPVLVSRFINHRISAFVDARPIWADLLEVRIVRIPDAVTSGTVSLTKGSKVVTGSGTSWPVSDQVNTSLASPIDEVGYVEAKLASLAGINHESVLMIDAGASEEIVPVVEIGESTVWLKGIQKPHSATAPVRQSSLVGRQFRINLNHPVYTVRAVRTPTELELNEPWWGDSVVGAKYRIVKMYISFGPNLRFIHTGLDPRVPSRVRLHVSQAEMNWRDPQRSSTGVGAPLELIDLAPNENGAMLYELWPEQSTARELVFLISNRWPELVRDNDRPPPFVDPQIFINGAIADALRVRVDESDPWHNPRLADVYEAKYSQLLRAAIEADDARVLKTVRNMYANIESLMGGNADFWVRHDPAQVFWDFA